MAKRDAAMLPPTTSESPQTAIPRGLKPAAQVLSGILALSYLRMAHLLGDRERPIRIRSRSRHPVHFSPRDGAGHLSMNHSC